MFFVGNKKHFHCTHVFNLIKDGRAKKKLRIAFFLDPSFFYLPQALWSVFLFTVCFFLCRMPTFLPQVSAFQLQLRKPRSQPRLELTAPLTPTSASPQTPRLQWIATIILVITRLSTLACTERLGSTRNRQAFVPLPWEHPLESHYLVLRVLYATMTAHSHS